MTTNIVYPPGAFIQNGGRVINVKNAPYRARGDGISDDTQAIIEAYNFVADALRAHNPYQSNDASYILYFPSGTYLVSDTLIYSGARLKQGNSGLMVRLRLIGQNRNNTTIRLQDNAAGFGAGAHKVVVAFQKEYAEHQGNNTPASNQVRNLTIDTGRGNAGAIALMFLGANKCSLGDVTIRSGDGTGAIGLDLPVWSVQGYLHDLTIEGFDNGIHVGDFAETNPTLEYLTLQNQKQRGVWVERGSPCLRKLHSDNRVPALEVTGEGAQVVLLDSELNGGAPDAAAVRMPANDSQLFARHVESSGYHATIQRGEEIVARGRVDENVAKTYTLFDAPAHSLNLPVEESPVLPWEPLEQWACVDDFSGTNDSQRIQNALNSGKAALFFGRSSYDLTEPVQIPDTVRHLDFGYTQPNIGAHFMVAQSSKVPLVIENLEGRADIEIHAARDLVLRHSSVNDGSLRNLQKEPITIWLEATTGGGASENFCPPNTRIYGRSINNEIKSTANFKVFGGQLWTLGFKTEGHNVSFEVRNNGVCEVLGGYRNETTPDQGLPMLINDNSQVAFVGYTSMASIYQNAIWETRNGETRKLMRTDLPPRNGYKEDFYVPLYSGYQARK